MPQIIRPQPKQEQFLSNPADIVIYGGRCRRRGKVMEFII